MGKFDLCRAVINEIHTMNDKYCSLGIHKKISKGLREYRLIEINRHLL